MPRPFALLLGIQISIMIYDLNFGIFVDIGTMPLYVAPGRQLSVDGGSYDQEVVVFVSDSS